MRTKAPNGMAAVSLKGRSESCFLGALPIVGGLATAPMIDYC